MFVLSPLRHWPIRRIWLGQVLAATGAEFYMVAVLWSAVDLIGREAGYVSALQAGAVLAGSLVGGIWTDRWTHGRTMVAVDLGRALLVLLLPLAHWFGVMSLGLLLTVAVLVAGLTASFDPALQATVPLLAPDVTLRQATNGLFDATKRLARIAGPGLIALLNGILPTVQFFTVTAIGFAGSAIAIRHVVRRLDEAPPARDANGLAGIAESLTAGFRLLRGHPVFCFGLFASVIGNATWSGGYLLGMALLLRQSAADPLTAYGLMASAYGIGNVLANIVLASRPPGRAGRHIVLGKLIFGLGMIAMPYAPGQAALMAVAALTAINGPLGDLAMLNLLQTSFPPGAVARVYRVQVCVSWAGMLLGYAIAPSLFRHVALAPAISGLGACTVAVALAGFILLSRRRAAATPRP